MRRLAIMAATRVAVAWTASVQSGELGGGFSILLDGEHFVSFGVRGVF